MEAVDKSTDAIATQIVDPDLSALDTDLSNGEDEKDPYFISKPCHDIIF